MKKRPYLLNGILLGVSFILSIALGAVFIPPGTIFRIGLDQLPYFSFDPYWPDHFVTILMKIRLPHTILVAVTGAALAGSGAAYQGLFRNPLADPYMIGVASGAGLGAVFFMAQPWLGNYLIPVGAFLGGLVTVLVVYSMARVGKMVPLTTLILAGVAVGSFTSAVTSFLMLRADDRVHRALAFLMGGAPAAGWEPVKIALPYMFVGLSLLLLSGHSLNVLQFGEEQAKQLGLSVERVKAFVIIAASLTAAGAVSFSGVIGFIGLIVPHLIRILWGGDYKRLIPLSIIGGGTFLLLADMVARIALAPQSLPVGIVTALVGAPFFLWILRRAKKKVFW
jgi:iron complex transport system permease protein